MREEWPHFKLVFQMWTAGSSHQTGPCSHRSSRRTYIGICLLSDQIIGPSSSVLTGSGSPKISDRVFSPNPSWKSQRSDGILGKIDALAPLSYSSSLDFVREGKANSHSCFPPSVWEGKIGADGVTYKVHL